MGVAHRLGDELVRKIGMDAQHRMWEQNLKNNSKLENAIAVIGFKAALIIGILSHEEDDSDSDTGISSKFDSSTEINENCENEKEEKVPTIGTTTSKRITFKSSR